MSSVAGFQAAPGLAVYSATKAYVTSLTEALHEEVRSSGVHVTALCPGLTKTEFQQRSNTQSYSTSYPDFVWTSAESVAATGSPTSPSNAHSGGARRALQGDGRAPCQITPRFITRRLSGMVGRT